MTTPKTVDFYFDFSSTNSYFAAFMLPELCARNGARVSWLPLHAAAMFRGTGFDVMAMTARKGRYLWRDHARYAEVTGLPFRRPSRFPIKTSTALRGVLAAGRIASPQHARLTPGSDGAATGARSDLTAQAAGAFTQAVFRAYWERDEDIGDRAVLRAIAVSAGLDGERLMELAGQVSVREELGAITERAIERGVFGVPSFFVSGEMFWGKDRLDFVERWLQRG